MVVMSLEKYSNLIAETEIKLDEADKLAEESKARYSNEEVFGEIRGVLNGSKAK